MKSSWKAAVIRNWRILKLKVLGRKWTYYKTGLDNVTTHFRHCKITNELQRWRDNPFHTIDNKQPKMGWATMIEFTDKGAEKNVEGYAK